LFSGESLIRETSSFSEQQTTLEITIETTIETMIKTIRTIMVVYGTKGQDV
jgi:hypothetical protein